MPVTSRNQFDAYVVAFVSAAAATGARILLDPLLGDYFPFATLFFAVIVSAWHGGFGPAVACLLSGAVLATRFLLPPRDSFSIEDFYNQAGLVLYLVTGLGIALVGAAMWKARGQALRIAEAAQQQGEELRTTLHSIGDAVIVTDALGRVIAMNPVAEGLTGWDMQDAKGKQLGDIFVIRNETTGAEVESPVQKVLLEGKAVGLANHTVLIDRNGTSTPIDDSAAPIRGRDGKLIGVVLVFRDIRARKQQWEWFRATLQSIADAVITTDVKGRVTFMNSAAEGLIGIPLSRVRLSFAEHVVHLLDEDAREAEFNPVLEVLQRGETWHAPLHAVFRDLSGAERPIAASAAPIQDPSGNILGVVITLRDISERRHTEAQVEESEERLRLALDAGRMGTWDWNIQTNEIKWSANLETVHGLDPGTFAGTFESFQKIVHPEDREKVQQAIANAVARCSNYDIEFRSIRSDGSIQWTAGKGKVFCDEQNRPLRMLGIGMDVTERRRNEEVSRFLADASAALAKLVDMQETLQHVARHSVPFFADWCSVDMLQPDGTLGRVAVAHVDPNKVQLAHDLHRRYPPDPTAPTGVWNILRTGKAEIIPVITDELLVSSVSDVELLGIIRDLGLRSYMAVPISARDKTMGVITFIVAESGRIYSPRDLEVAEDLAHRAAVAIENNQLYQALKEADRRKDEFLAMLAHELRNPLAPVRNALHILSIPSAQPEMLAKAREMAQRQVHHLTRLVDDLLDVSRIMRGKIELRKRPVTVREIIDRALETARPTVDAAGHELTVELPPHPLWVDADLIRMAQVVSNLVHNAAKYTERGGSIQVTVTEEARQARIAVKDNGIGITADLLPHIFDMFTQAAPASDRSQGGLGIGLTLVKNLIELHGGQVEAHSEGPGQGSLFIARIPLHNTQSVVEPGTDGKAPSPMRKRDVLVVDDNVDAAESLALILRLQGHTVRVCHNGFAALDEARGRLPEIAFLDIGMPGMDGYEVARQLRAMQGGKRLSITAITGWGKEQDRRRSKEAGFDNHLTKPVDPSDVEAILRGR